jgi:hypothetical protein
MTTDLPIGEPLPALPGRVEPPLNNRVWRLGLLVAAGCMAGFFAEILFGQGRSLTVLLIALFMGTAWYAAVRLLFLKTRLRVVWLVAVGGRSRATHV